MSIKRTFPIIPLIISVTCDSHVQGDIVGESLTGIASKVEQRSTKTIFKLKDSAGKEYPIYMFNGGSCFIIRPCKTGNIDFLGTEIYRQICNELGIETKNKCFR